MALAGGYGLGDSTHQCAAHHNAIGSDRSHAYDFQEGDSTHLNHEGAMAIAGLVVTELVNVLPETAAYLEGASSTETDGRRQMYD